MVKFFVYTSAKDEYEFVEEDAIEHFAAHEFDPGVMQFSGVAIEADDFDKAMDVYRNPACGHGEYMMSDEPSATFTRRQMREVKGGLEQSFKDAKFKLEYLRCIMKMKQASMYMQMASKLIQDVATDLHVMYGTPKHITPPKIFEQLSQSTIQAVVKFNGDTKKTG
jgi:hypothetical protein